MLRTIKSKVVACVITVSACLSLSLVTTSGLTNSISDDAEATVAGTGISRINPVSPENKVSPPPFHVRTASLHPFVASSPWNTAIGSNAQFESSSSTKTASFLTSAPVVINRSNWSISLRQASNSDPLATLESVRTKETFKVRIPADTVATGGTDRHVTIISPDGFTSYDAYKMEKVSDTHWVSQIVRVVNLRESPGIGSGVRAARTPATAGLIRKHEVANKDIPHAVAVAVPDSTLKVGFVWPAYAQDSNAATAYHGQVPMGTLLAIPPSVDINTVAVSPEGRALGKALQNYGAYVVDRAGSAALFCELNCDSTATSRMNTDWKNLFKQMRVVSNNSANSVGGGGTPRISPALPF